MCVENLRFGIPSLDGLIRVQDELAYSPGVEFGNGTVSACISGPAGTGKSVLALHLASRYAADVESGSHTCVIYASTDLSHTQADNAWAAFDLAHPDTRIIPFADGYNPRHNGPSDLGCEVKLTEYRFDPEKLARYIENTQGMQDLCKGQYDPREVGFINLQRSTAGDDWGFLNRLIASLPEPGEESRHLLVVDAVEGLETLAGNVDSFGISRARRSRVAQLLRTAGEKCHVLFIVEDLRLVEREIEENPEEYVTDIVLRLSNLEVGQYRRRVVEAVKVRFGSHLRGEHQILIRNGSGSSTGEQINWDDPRVLHQNCSNAGNSDLPEEKKKKQGYVHVVRSLHSVNRQIMRDRTGNRPVPPPDRFAEFGIKYLDDMLAKPRNQGKHKSFHDEGLPCGMLTALIGDEGTLKSQLGHAFIARAFAPEAQELWDLLKPLQGSTPVPPDLTTFLEKRCPSQPPIEAKAFWNSLRNNAFRDKSFRPLGEAMVRYFKDYWSETDSIKTDFEKYCKHRDEINDPINQATKTRMLYLIRTKVVPYVRYRLVDPGTYGQAAVYFCTDDIHASSLADRYIAKLCSDYSICNETQEQTQDPLRIVFEAAMRILIQHYLICRRLEIHDLSSALLAHIIDAAVKASQKRLIPSCDPNDSTERFLQSSRIRLVINDFRLIRDTYPDVKEDPLFLPNLRFYLGREGVTALLVDSHPGRPDVALADRFDSELRAIVDHHLYTWRIPFQGYSRVAIAAVPPIGTANPVLVRELTSHWNQPGDPIYVDPRLELWDGLLEGSPKRVALEVKLAGLTSAGRKYADQVNTFLRDLFTPVALDGRIVQEEPPSYESLRTSCYLQTGVQLDHSLIFTVDEFWGGGDRLPGLRDCTEYLGATPSDDSEGFTDSHDLFSTRWTNPSEQPSTRHARFAWPGKTWTVQTDRVPYTWDFGFLLCQELAWRESYRLSLPVLEKTIREFLRKDLPTAPTLRPVHEVLRFFGQDLAKGPRRLGERAMDKSAYSAFLEALEPEIPGTSWRVILEACSVVAAHSPVTTETHKVYAFDVDMVAPETFSCLVLEMWMSEILMRSNGDCRTRKWLDRQEERQFSTPKDGKDPQWLPSLKDLVSDHHRELFSVLILLAEVFEEGQFAVSDSGFEFKPQECRTYAVATRHWYSTANQAITKSHDTNRLRAVSLPGRFSVRGDWFLAAAEGSRSRRVTDEALDLLSSRRANYDRLQWGIGLPTRDILPEHVDDDSGSIRTALAVTPKSSLDSGLTYHGLKRLGARPKSDLAFGDRFYWLWRSQILHYDHDRVPWLKWLLRAINALLDLKREQGAEWESGFKLYDQLHYRGQAAEVIATEPYKEFEKLVKGLVARLPDPPRKGRP